MGQTTAAKFAWSSVLPRLSSLASEPTQTVGAVVPLNRKLNFDQIEQAIGSLRHAIVQRETDRSKLKNATDEMIKDIEDKMSDIIAKAEAECQEHAADIEFAKQECASKSAELQHQIAEIQDRINQLKASIIPRIQNCEIGPDDLRAYNQEVLK